jgi:hypothetical protein
MRLSPRGALVVDQTTFPGLGQEDLPPHPRPVRDVTGDPSNASEEG